MLSRSTQLYRKYNTYLASVIYLHTNFRIAMRQTESQKSRKENEKMELKQNVNEHRIKSTKLKAEKKCERKKESSTLVMI